MTAPRFGVYHVWEHKPDAVSPVAGDAVRAADGRMSDWPDRNPPHPGGAAMIGRATAFLCGRDGPVGRAALRSRGAGTEVRAGKRAVARSR
jgi:hypothetical protein